MRAHVTIAVLGAVLGTVGCSSYCQIDSVPQGATVTVDGQVIGKTPVSYGFSNSGFRYNYDVRADLEGYESDLQIVKPAMDAWGSGSWPSALIFRLRPIAPAK